MTVDWKKKLIPNLPYLLFVYLFDKLCQAVRLAPGLDASEKFLHLSQGFTEAFSSGLPSLHPLDLLAGIAGAVIVRLAHSVLRKYGVCRVCFRELAYKGEIPGVKKASW